MSTLDVIIVSVVGAFALGMIIRHSIIRYRVSHDKNIGSAEYVKKMASKKEE